MILMPEAYYQFLGIGLALTMVGLGTMVGIYMTMKHTEKIFASGITLIVIGFVIMFVGIAVGGEYKADVKAEIWETDCDDLKASYDFYSNEHEGVQFKPLIVERYVMDCNSELTNVEWLT